MNRSRFIKNLIGIYGIANLPVSALTHFEKVYIKHFSVLGFQYYDGPNILHSLNSSGMVELVREPDNIVDKRAIAIYFEDKKIGYVPRESNKTLSILLDADLLTFHAEITHIETAASDWEKIKVAIYALKEIKSATDLQKIEAYTLLQTPTYYTIQSEGNTITRIKNEDMELFLKDMDAFAECGKI